MDEADRWYRTLDLEPGASPEEVKRAWRDLTKVWHPDRFQGDLRMEAKAEEKLKAINLAYQQLTDLPRQKMPTKPPTSASRPNATRQTARAKSHRRSVSSPAPTPLPPRGRGSPI